MVAIVSEMNVIPPSGFTTDTTEKSYPELSETLELCNHIRRVLVRSEDALVQGDVHENVEKLERWIEAYRNGLYAAKKIAENAPDILCKTREKLHLALEERLRLEDEGGNPPADSSQAKETEDLRHGLRRIDNLIECLNGSFLAPVCDQVKH